VGLVFSNGIDVVEQTWARAEALAVVGTVCEPHIVLDRYLRN
jgi:hypothetical protein